jgi:transcriptional regulator with XRE-family HTH domain
VTEPVDYMPVGERIAIYRRRRGLSQLALANMVGRSEAWLSQVERGIRHVDRLSVIIRLAQVLRVTVEDLVGQPLSLAPNGGAECRAIPALRAALTDYEVIPTTLGTVTRDAGPVRELPSLQRNVDQANRLYQAAHYEEARPAVLPAHRRRPARGPRAGRRRPPRCLRCPCGDLPRYREDADQGGRDGTGLDRRRAFPPGR